MSSVSEFATLAPGVIAAHADLSDNQIFHPVAAFLPKAQSTVVDIGAGIGRTAAWLARKGKKVTAVEPVHAFRAAGAARFGDPSIRWIDDALPNLTQLMAPQEQFDTVIMSGVWHLLPPSQRDLAMLTVSQLVKPKGHILMSLRHGPSPGGITTYPIDTSETVMHAQSHDIVVEFQTTAPSVQKANQTQGVTWTWLVLTRP